MKAAIHHPGKTVAIGIAIAVALVALLPGAWGTALAATAGDPDPAPSPTSPAPSPTTGTTTAPSPTTVTVGVTPGQTTTASLGESTAGSKTVSVPAGAFTQNVEIRTEIREFVRQIAGPIIINHPITGEPLITVPAVEVTDVDLVDVSTVVLEVFDLDALTAGGESVQPGEPVTLSFELTPETLAAAGGNPDNVRLAFFDEDADRWQDVSCNASGTTLSCTLPHFSLWALYAVTEAPAGPPAAVPVPADTGMGTTTSEGGSAALMLIGGVMAIAAVTGIGARFATRRIRG